VPQLAASPVLITMLNQTIWLAPMMESTFTYGSAEKLLLASSTMINVLNQTIWLMPMM
jgi:hypothetical protein